jgi:DNA-binding MarR family transcriptional regulator
MLDAVKYPAHNPLMVDADEPGETRELIDGLLRAAREIERTVALIAARHDLTTQQLMLLRALEQPVPMSNLAVAKGCDPSNVTGLVDRIARLGLVERLTDTQDRRVRLLSLTPEGRRIRDRIDHELAHAMSESFAGSRAERAELSRLLRGMAGR